METHEIEIFCVILGEFIPFPIEIERGKSVSDLKNKIYDAKKNTLPKIDANQLKLYHGDIPKYNDIAKAVEQKLSHNLTELGAFDKLAHVFGNVPKKKTIHVIVQPPESGKQRVLAKLIAN